MYLQQFQGTVIAVTHDRYFLDNVAGWILELDRGEGIPWKGNYSSWLEQKAKRLDQEEKQESKRKKTLQKELDWVRMNPKARQAKSKARLNEYEKLASQENKERIKKLELYIPSELGYGDSGSPPKIGGGDALIFIMEMIDIQGDKVPAIKCDVITFDNCTDKEKGYIEKAKQKFPTVDDIKAEVLRINKVSQNVSVTASEWAGARVRILIDLQVAAGKEEL
jgi:hypothetical protein